MSQPNVTTNRRVMSNGDASENRGVGVDRYVVLEYWRGTFSILPFSSYLKLLAPKVTP